jgi:hypothetical protein
MKTVTLNKRSVMGSIGLAAVLAGLLIPATASAAAPPPNHMSMAEACARPDTRCFPLPSGAGTWAMLTQAEEKAPSSASPDPHPADRLEQACARADTRCFPLPSGPAQNRGIDSGCIPSNLRRVIPNTC